MNTATHYYFSGLGQSKADIAVQASTQVAMQTVPQAVGPSVAAILGISTTAAIPIVGAAIAAISLGIEAILHSGCGQTCVVTSQWANQAEGHLQQNISEYFAIAAPRPKSVQQLAMANFQAIWNTLVQQCSQPGLGTAGKNCIADRKDGACKWKAKPPAYPGQPAAGACWNWWNGYYYPIANDTQVVDDTTLSGSLSSTLSSILPGGNTMLWLGLGLVGVALVMSL